ncbi:MAG: aminotransferase class V-fold PLP-dependent enzyme [Ignavibacteria bacterium]
MIVNSFEEARELFPMAKSCVYLDSAHYAPYSTETRRRLLDFINKFTETNYNLSIFHNEISIRLKEKISRLINSGPEDIILTSSTTHGLNIFANGINTEDCKNTAYADSEFPAVVYAWMNQEKLRGIKNFLIPSKNGKIKLSDVEKVLSENKIDVLTISTVEFLGFKNDLDALREITNKYNTMFVVDAIQSIGAVPMDVKKHDIDFLAAGSQKWMMSPAGTGFAYIKKTIKKHVSPTYVSTMSIDFDFTNFLDYKFKLKEDGIAYENSTPNTLGMIGLESSMDLFLSLGTENIFKQITKILDRFIDGIGSCKNFYVESDMREQHRSNILIFSHKDRSRNAEIQKELEEKKVYIALREGYLRVSPHLFNNEDDIDRLLESLEKY